MAKTTVAGVDISGKNPEEVRRLLDLIKTQGNVNAGTTEQSAAPAEQTPAWFDALKKATTEGTSMYGGAGYTGGSTAPDIQSQLIDAQRKATLAALDKSRQQGLASLEQEKATIEPAYAEQRSLARGTSRTGGRAFQEYMAQRGLQRSGGAALGETQRLGALQGSLGALGRQQTAAYGNIAQRRSALEQGYASDVASAEAGLQAQNLQYQLQQQQLAEERQRQATEQQRADILNTMGAYAGDYQAQINTLQNDGDPSNDWQIPYLQSMRQQKISTLGLDQQGNVIPTAMTLTPNQALDLWNITGTATPEIADALGVDVGARYSTYTGRTRTSGVRGGGATAYTPTNQDQLSLASLANGYANSGMSNAEIINELNDPATQQAIIAQYGEWAFTQMVKEAAGGAGEVLEVAAPTYLSATEADELAIEGAVIKGYRGADETWVPTSYDKNIVNSNITYLLGTGQIDDATARTLRRKYGLATYSGEVGGL